MPTTRSGKESFPTSSILSSSRKQTKRTKRTNNTNSLDHSIPAIQTSLPDDIIHNIISNLSAYSGTLANCCLVSKMFYRVASPVLWRHLKLNPWKIDDGKKVLDGCKESFGGINDRQTGRKKHREDVRIFSLWDHPPEWCQPQRKTALTLPKLQVLRIHTTMKAIHIFTPYDSEIPKCRILSNLSPSRLVLRGIPLYNIDLSRIPLSESSWSKMEEITFISSGYEAARNSSCCHRFTSVFALPSLKRIFWIFDPSSPPHSWNASQSPSIPLHCCCLVKLLIQLPKIPLTIVNLDATGIYHPGRVGLSFEDISYIAQNYLIDGLTQVMDDYGWNEDQIQERCETFRFVSLQGYIVDEDWVDILDKKELDKWVKVMQTQEEDRHQDKAENGDGDEDDKQIEDEDDDKDCDEEETEQEEVAG
ncbi:uncharacterized protein IL334_001717 [Kwoniella shivajii]|uniref:F-box domain-containing protein n=1 Tax=Kwoniella shivajii TaxID=564305 RepID=A0ABZ1CTC2_9TREE|nr:hypothetical protein IL334_001717 [Kwoniella shivajii]